MLSMFFAPIPMASDIDLNIVTRSYVWTDILNRLSCKDRSTQLHGKILLIGENVSVADSTHDYRIDIKES